MADKWYDTLDPTKMKTRRECYSLASPKSEAGADDARILASAIPAVRDYLTSHPGGPDDLVFPVRTGEYLDQKTFKMSPKGWYDARKGCRRMRPPLP